MFIRGVICVACSAQLLFAGTASARSWSAGLSKVVSYGEHSMPYRLYVPKNYDPEQSYPLLLFLHGAGERGTNNSSQVSRYISGMIDRTYEEYPAFLVAPQIPSGSYWWPGNSTDLTPLALDDVISIASIDTSRMYVTGLSMGGFGSFDYLYYYSTYETNKYHFAAAAPLSGGFVGSYDPESVASFKDVPQWIMHGDSDTTVGPYLSEETYKSLVGSGPGPITYDRYHFGRGMTAMSDPIRYTKLLGMGHNIWSLVYSSDDDALYDWMFAQSYIVPEPSGFALLGGALLALLLYRGGARVRPGKAGSRAFFLLLACLCCGLGSSVAATTASATTVLMNDTLDVGAAPTRLDDVDDPNDADWFAVSPKLGAGDGVDYNLFLIEDPEGINGFKSLQVGNSGLQDCRTWANFPALTLDHLGEWLEVTFDLRLPVVSDTGVDFLFGLYSSDTVPGGAPSADKTDDDGYLCEADGYLVAVWGHGAPAVSVFRETDDSSAITLPTFADIDNFDPPPKHANRDATTFGLDTEAHTLSMKLTRAYDAIEGFGTRIQIWADGDLLIDVVDDGRLENHREFEGTPPVTFSPEGHLTTFNGVCMNGYHTVPVYLLDNVTVSTGITPVLIPGDTDNDGDVDADDLGTLTAHWGSPTTAGASEGDFDGDNLVGPRDAAILAANWNFGVGESALAGTVPEPSGSALVATAMLASLIVAGSSRARTAKKRVLPF